MNVLPKNETAVNLDVGGYLFTLFFDDLAKHRDTFFDTILKKEWRQETEKTVKIERDGRLFRFVLAYLVTGCLPRDKFGVISLSSEEIIAIREEADYFNLPGLIEECNSLTLKVDDCVRELKSFQAIDNINVPYNFMNNIDHYNIKESELLNALSSIPRSEVVSVYSNQDQKSFAFSGKRIVPAEHQDSQLLKSSTIDSLNIPELLAEATQSSFGKGTHTLVDTTVRDSVELPASSLNVDTLQWIVQELTPKIHWYKQKAGLELRPYKLVIYQEGGHFHAHRDTVRGEGHIGTVVLILNSDYTGGELEIVHAGETVSVTGAYRWVAMYGDCLHQIKPVTSGTRVSLIFDIYTTPDAVLRPSAQVDCPAEKAALVAELSKELEKYEAVAICLEHLYPKHQAVPGYLKGHDATLYAILQEDFDLQIAWATVEEETYEESYGANDEVRAKLVDSLVFASANKKYSKLNVKFVIPDSLNSDYVLKHTPYLDYTGNEAQPEQNLYLVTGLLVRARSTQLAKCSKVSHP